MAVRSKELVGGRFISGIAGSNSAKGMEVIFSCLICVVQIAGSPRS